MKRFFCFLIASTILIFSGCEANVALPDTTQASSQELTTKQAPPITLEPTGTQAYTDNSQASDVTISETLQHTQPATKPAPVPTVAEPTTVTPTAPATTTPAAAPEETETMGKTGEMVFSDDPNNRYIKAIASKYNVSADTLVALYTVPENDSNIVLEFDGTKNEDGTLKRNKDTLIAIYSINKSLESKRASENRKLNEYSYGEMKVMFISVTTYIMPEFEELK